MGIKGRESLSNEPNQLFKGWKALINITWNIIACLNLHSSSLLPTLMTTIWSNVWNIFPLTILWCICISIICWYTFHCFWQHLLLLYQHKTISKIFIKPLRSYTTKSHQDKRQEQQLKILLPVVYIRHKPRADILKRGLMNVNLASPLLSSLWGIDLLCNNKGRHYEVVTWLRSTRQEEMLQDFSKPALRRI